MAKHRKMTTLGMILVDAVAKCTMEQQVLDTNAGKQMS
jgi:hypothetical protein